MDQDDLDRYAEAIAAVESEGSGGYRAIGPRTRTGDFAIGRYQVMASNVPQWTYEATGRAMSPQQFYASPEAQDAVFRHRFGQYVQQYGNPYDAASAWFTGRPLSRGGASSDGYINGYTYVNRFARALQNPRQQLDFASYGVAQNGDTGGAGGQPAPSSASTQPIDFASFGAPAEGTSSGTSSATAPQSVPLAYSDEAKNIAGFPPVSSTPMSGTPPSVTVPRPAQASAAPSPAPDTSYGYGGSGPGQEVANQMNPRPGVEMDLSPFGLPLQ